MKRNFPQAPPWVDAAIFRQKINEFCDTPGVDVATCEAFAVGVMEIGGEHVPYAPMVAFYTGEPAGRPSCRLVGRRILRPFGPTLEVVGSLPGERGLSGTWRRFCRGHDRIRRVFLCPSLYDAMILETFSAHAPEACVFWAEHEPQFDDLIFLSKIPQGADFTLVYRNWKMALPWATAWAKLAQRAAWSVHVKTYNRKTLLEEILTRGYKF